jgi:hypothetical protein
LLTHYLYKKNARYLSKADKNANYQSLSYSVSALAVSTEFNHQYKKDFYLGVNAKSSAELAKKYHKKSVPESGNIALAIDAIKDKGLCFEKDLPSENFGAR